MPWDSGPVVLYYRRDMFEKAGVDPASIETWDDFVEAGKKVVAANGEGVRESTVWIRICRCEIACRISRSAGMSKTSRRHSRYASSSMGNCG